ncbi:hypothetical protein B0H14DRAFT_3141926 [Mycena olivaceomarginata]|nr:hypothetical protein B0H14DRAFT_3141926 [Mycena olivaceomarginata]
MNIVNRGIPQSGRLRYMPLQILSGAGQTGETVDMLAVRRSDSPLRGAKVVERNGGKESQGAVAAHDPVGTRMAQTAETDAGTSEGCIYARKMAYGTRSQLGERALVKARQRRRQASNRSAKRCLKWQNLLVHVKGKRNGRKTACSEISLQPVTLCIRSWATRTWDRRQRLNFLLVKTPYTRNGYRVSAIKGRGQRLGLRDFLQERRRQAGDRRIGMTMVCGRRVANPVLDLGERGAKILPTSPSDRRRAKFDQGAVDLCHGVKAQPGARITQMWRRWDRRGPS